MATPFDLRKSMAFGMIICRPAATSKVVVPPVPLADESDSTYRSVNVAVALPRLVRINSDSKALVSTRTGRVSLVPLCVPVSAWMKEPSFVDWSLTTPYAPNGPLPVTLSMTA